MRNIDAKIPERDKKAILEKKVRDLFKLGYSDKEISRLLSMPKTSVFYIRKGRKQSAKRSP